MIRSDTKSGVRLQDVEMVESGHVLAIQPGFKCCPVIIKKGTQQSIIERTDIVMRPVDEVTMSRLPTKTGHSERGTMGGKSDASASASSALLRQRTWLEEQQGGGV